MINTILNGENIIRSSARQLVPMKYKEGIKQYLSRKNKREVTISPMAREYLINVFKSDINNLASLIDRDLSGWLTAPYAPDSNQHDL